MVIHEDSTKPHLAETPCDQYRAAEMGGQWGHLPPPKKPLKKWGHNLQEL